MNQFLSGRQQELKVGIVSYTENKTVLDVTGNTNVSGIVTFNSFTSEMDSIAAEIAFIIVLFFPSLKFGTHSTIFFMC